MNVGAIHMDLMLHIGYWRFGIHFDLYTIGLDIGLGLGPLYPRLFLNSSCGGFRQWNWQPCPWSYRESKP